MWKLDCEESWALKNWCFWTVVLEKTPASPLDCKEIQPVHFFIGRTDAEIETPILWPYHAKSWLIGKDSDAGRNWGQEEKGTTEDEMAGWHHRLDGHEFGCTPGVGDGQGSLAGCDSWGRRVGQNWVNEMNWMASLTYTYKATAWTLEWFRIARISVKVILKIIKYNMFKSFSKLFWHVLNEFAYS